MLTTLSPAYANCPEILAASTSWNAKASPDLKWHSLVFYIWRNFQYKPNSAYRRIA